MASKKKVSKKKVDAELAKQILILGEDLQYSITRIQELEDDVEHIGGLLSKANDERDFQEKLVTLQREHMVKLRTTLKLAKDANDAILNYLALNETWPIFRKPRVKITNEYERIVKALEHVSSVISMNNTSPEEILKLAQNQCTTENLPVSGLANSCPPYSGCIIPSSGPSFTQGITQGII